MNKSLKETERRYLVTSDFPKDATSLMIETVMVLLNSVVS